MEKYKWLNNHSKLFLSRGYLSEGITAQTRIRHILDTVEEHYGIKGYADETEEFFAEGCYSLSTPYWTNLATDKGLPISCNGSYISDTMESILDKISEVGMMSKRGAGTSAYFGGLRSRGSSISVGGKSSGPVHFMELFDKVADVVSQGSARRGSFAAYLPIDHPDILEFLRIRSEGHPIQNMSIGVTITDNWMNEMIDGDREKRGIWAKIIQKRFETGYPYIFFTDTVNNNAPQVYKDKGLFIYASNLCVTGDTLIEILINDNERVSIQIKDLGFYIQKYKNIKVKSYNIDSKMVCYSDITDFAQTGESTDLIEIEDERGNILRCTPDHKIYTKNRWYVLAKDLQETDSLENFEKI